MSKFWGSRFQHQETDKLADQFSFSIVYDHRLAKYDVITSIAHVKMLDKCKIIPHKDAASLINGLKQIEKQIEEGNFKIDPKAEDIHTHIFSVLKNIVGESADKLHTARSRNDLVVTDLKLYCLVELTEIYELIVSLQKTIVKLAEKNRFVIIPAYTHLQAAQVVLLAHHLLAYVEMLERDKERFFQTIKRTNTMPLGSCALSGTSLSIDRHFTAVELGFAEPMNNSIDAVSDRDFVVEALCDLSILAMHFSRIAEDMIIFSTNEFKFMDIDWSLCTGSSIMPHKKNPDILELIRGQTAKVYGALQEILVLLKGLPLTYNRDLQLDKPPLFQSVEKVKLMLKLLDKMFATLKINQEVIAERIKDENFFTVDIMEYLIKQGVSYREAHDTVGKIVKECLDQGKKIVDLTEQELKKYSPQFSEDVKKLFDPEISVKIKKSLGSTNPHLVMQQVFKWKKKLFEH